MTAMTPPLGSVVDVYETLVVGGDLLGGLLAAGAAVDERLQRIPPDRAPDREADVPGRAAPAPPPRAARLVVGPAPQDHAYDAVAPVPPGRRRDRLAVLARVDPLDLPDVRLHAGVLQLADRRVHQLGALLRVPLGLAAGRLDLLGRGGHEELEQEPAIVFVQPAAEVPEPGGLPDVHVLVRLRVVANEHLGEVRVERLDVVAELVAVLEVELILPALLHRHREAEPHGLRVARDAGSELLVHEHPSRRRVNALVQRAARPLEDDALGVCDLAGLVLVRLALDAEELLLERPSVIERQDVQLPVVPELHRSSS